VTVNGVVSSYFYDQNDRMYFEGNNAVAFDANGNMLGLPSKGATYAYDPEDRLTKATHTAGATVDYAYDGEGARIETKVTQGAATSTTKHLIDKNRAYAEVIEERDEAGNLTALYTHGHDLEGPVSQERFVAGAGTVSYYLTDHLGSTRFLVDSTGNVTDSYLYEPYGNVAQRTGTTPNSYQFTGEQFDQATGMTYLRARWLANGIARFVTVDLHQGDVRVPRSLHDYAYSNDNPVAFIDPLGTMAIASISLSGTESAGLQTRQALITGGQVYRANSALRRVAEGSVRTLRSLRQGGKGIWKDSKGVQEEIHHLVEKRLLSRSPELRNMFSNADDLAGAVLKQGEHRIYTARWRDAIPYKAPGQAPNRISLDEIIDAAYKVYYDQPAFFNRVLLQLR